MQVKKEMFYVNQSANEEDEIIKAKTQDLYSARAGQSFYSQVSDSVDQFSDSGLLKCNSTASSGSLLSSRTLPDDISLLHQVRKICTAIALSADREILTDQAVEKLLVESKTFEDWLLNFKARGSEIQTFFKNSTFLELIEEAFNSEVPADKTTLILTLDYFTNLVTFIFYLLWRWTKNESLSDSDQDFQSYTSCQTTIIDLVQTIIKYRFNEIRAESALLTLLETFNSFIPKHLIEDCSQPLTQLQGNYHFNLVDSSFIQGAQILPWSPIEFANMLTFQNQRFFAELQVRDLLRDLLKKRVLQKYFYRINALSMFIIYSVVKNPTKHERQLAVGYWLEVCQQLNKNEDLEGLFIVFKYGIDVLLKDYANKMPILFRDQDTMKNIYAAYQEKIKENYKNAIQQKPHCVPSFHKYWSSLKNLEVKVKQDKRVLQQIAIIVQQLMDLARIKSQLLRKEERKITFQEVAMLQFINFGAQMVLERDIGVPLDKDALIQIQLIKMSRKQRI